MTVRDGGRRRENPYRYAEARGEVVEMLPAQKQRSHIDDLAVEYTRSVGAIRRSASF